VTRIDRYIIGIYIRTLLICFCSLGGIFVVFHAFSNLEALSAHATAHGGIVWAMLDYYSPYLLLIFESTNAILALLALLFTIGWLRQSGELTALLAAGIRHGRILRPMLIAAAVVIAVGLVNREWALPKFQSQLGSKPNESLGDVVQPMHPEYDRRAGILVAGEGLIGNQRKIVGPAFRLFARYPGFGDQLLATSAHWLPAAEERPGGYLLRGVKRPLELSSVPSARREEETVIYSPADHDWLEADQCFVVTAADFDLLLAHGPGKKYVALSDIISRVRNAAVHTSTDLRLQMHGRFLRPLADYTLVLLGLPLAVSRREGNLFVMVGKALMVVAFFFGARSLFHAIGGAGYGLTPSLAAWGPLLLLGPIGYARYWSVQEV